MEKDDDYIRKESTARLREIDNKFASITEKQCEEDRGDKEMNNQLSLS